MRHAAILTGLALFLAVMVVFELLVLYMTIVAFAHWFGAGMGALILLGAFILGPMFIFVAVCAIQAIRREQRKSVNLAAKPAENAG